MLSGALHAEDARRRSVGEPLIRLDEPCRAQFAGAGLVTYRVREVGNPVGARQRPRACPVRCCCGISGLRSGGPPDLVGLARPSDSE